MQPWIRRPVGTTLFVYRPLSELILGHENMNIAGIAVYPTTICFPLFALFSGLTKIAAALVGTSLVGTHNYHPLQLGNPLKIPVG
jgi:hypothetical protein